MPRNIDGAVQQLDGVYLYNIDDLDAIVQANVKLREQELAVCREILDHRVAALMTKLNFEQERLYDASVQPRPGWIPDGAVVCRS